jgi:hypothetical protein
MRAESFVGLVPNWEQKSMKITTLRLRSGLAAARRARRKIDRNQNSVFSLSSVVNDFLTERSGVEGPEIRLAVAYPAFWVASSAFCLARSASILAIVRFSQCFTFSRSSSSV